MDVTAKDAARLMKNVPIPEKFRKHNAKMPQKNASPIVPKSAEWTTSITWLYRIPGER